MDVVTTKLNTSDNKMIQQQVLFKLCCGSLYMKFKAFQDTYIGFSGHFDIFKNFKNFSTASRPGSMQKSRRSKNPIRNGRRPP